MKIFSFPIRSCLALSFAGIVLFTVAVAYLYLKFVCSDIPEDKYVLEDRNADRVLSRFRKGSLILDKYLASFLAKKHLFLPNAAFSESN